MRKFVCLLLLLTSLQLTFDETLSHFDFSGNIDLKGSTSLAAVNSGLQKFHDHLWCFAFGNLQSQVQMRKLTNSISTDLTAGPGFPIRVWQPPKSSGC